MANVDLKQLINQVAAEKEKASDKKTDSTQVLVFELDKEEYAVSISVLREIIRVPDITPIPNAPDFIKGILNLRGQIVVLVDLEKRFHLVRENALEPKHIIITDLEGTYFGVLVDEVKEVLTVPIDRIRPTPDLVFAKIHAEYISGIVILGGEEEGDKKQSTKAEKSDTMPTRLIILLDLPKLLQEKELLQLGESIKTMTEGTTV